MDELDSLLATVDEFVDDENRIVTYKWLSEQLAIPVNKAKSLLQNYAESCKKRDNRIHIVYAIIGHDSTGISIKVVRDVDLDSAKSKMDKIYSVSLYSVQKMKLQDSSVLYATDYDTYRKNLTQFSKIGGISYSGAKCLSKDEIKHQKQAPSGAKEISADLAKQFAKPVPEKGKPTQQKVNFFAKTKTSPPKKQVKEEITDIKNKNEPQKSDFKKSDPPKAKEQKKGVAAFMTKNKTDPFASRETKSIRTPVDKKEEKSAESNINEKESSKSDETAKKSSPKKGVDKPTEKRIKEKQKTVPNVKNSSSKRSFDNDDLNIDDFPDDDDFVEKDKKMTKKVAEKVLKPKNVGKTSKNKKNSRHDSNDLPAKKRRRIQELSSSSSEDEDENTEEMEIPPPSPPPVAEIDPEPQIEEEKIAENGKINKRKKKVMKSRTFVDDEGCMVTEKYFEFEECDEPEPVANGDSAQPEKNGDKNNAVDAKQKKKLPSLSTAAQPKKQQKQASIMGFFKKK